jgi:hypothetical protein
VKRHRGQEYGIGVGIGAVEEEMNRREIRTEKIMEE